METGLSYQRLKTNSSHLAVKYKATVRTEASLALSKSKLNLPIVAKGQRTVQCLSVSYTWSKVQMYFSDQCGCHIPVPAPTFYTYIMWFHVGLKIGAVTWSEAGGAELIWGHIIKIPYMLHARGVRFLTQHAFTVAAHQGASTSDFYREGETWHSDLLCYCKFLALAPFTSKRRTVRFYLYNP